MARRYAKPDSEAMVHERIVRHMKREYPGVVFKTDFAAGIKLPIWLAARQRKVQYRRGYPDLSISKACRGYHGLFLEVKKPGTRIKKVSDGMWASDHIREQAEMMAELERAGYKCAFAVGYDQAVDILAWYLKEDDIALEFDDFSLQNHATPQLHHDQEVF